MLTTRGTLASRAATAPYTFGLMVMLQTRSMRSRRKIRYRARQSRASPTGFMNLAMSTGTCVVPSSRMEPTYGPGGVTANTRCPPAARAPMRPLKKCHMEKSSFWTSAIFMASAPKRPAHSASERWQKGDRTVAGADLGHLPSRQRAVGLREATRPHVDQYVVAAREAHPRLPAAIDEVVVGGDLVALVELAHSYVDLPPHEAGGMDDGHRNGKDAEGPGTADGGRSAVPVPDVAAGADDHVRCRVGREAGHHRPRRLRLV